MFFRTVRGAGEIDFQRVENALGESVGRWEENKTKASRNHVSGWTLGLEPHFHLDLKIWNHVSGRTASVGAVPCRVTGELPPPRGGGSPPVGGALLCLDRLGG